jgi:HEAT repeat protein
MTCQEARALLEQSSVEGALPAELTSHLEACAACREEQRRSVEILRQLHAARESLDDLRPRFEETSARAFRRAMTGGLPAVGSSWTRVRAAASLLIIALPVFWFLFTRALPPTPGGSRPQEDRVRKLIELLKDPAPEVRARAQDDLLDVGPSAGPVVKSALAGTSDLEVRSRLSQIAAVYRCQEVLGNDGGRRFGMAGGPVEKLRRLVEFLEGHSPRQLKDRDKEVLTEELHRGATREDQLRLIELYATPRDKGAPWGDEAVAREYAWVLPPLLGHPDSEVVLRGVVALARLGGLPAIPSDASRPALSARIADLLDSKNRTLRLSALEALGRHLKAEAEAPRIAPILEDPDPELRKAALAALGRLNAKRFSVDVARRLKDPDPAVRIAAVDVLRDWRAKEFIEAVAALLDTPGVEVRAHALTALGELDARAYAPQMAQALSEKSAPVELRVGALKGLRGLRAVEYIPDVVAQLQAPEGFVRALAVDVLGAFGARDRVGLVEDRLRDPDAMVRVFSAQTLAVLGVPGSKTALERALGTEQDPEARVAILEALRSFGK